MNNYVKPAIKLATVDGIHKPGTCNTTSSDMELIQSIIGIENMDNAFGMNEGCQVTIPLDMYCKFTSTEMGAVSVFWS